MAATFCGELVRDDAAERVLIGRDGQVADGGAEAEHPLHHLRGRLDLRALAAQHDGAHEPRVAGVELELAQLQHALEARDARHARDLLDERAEVARHARAPRFDATGELDAPPRDLEEGLVGREELVGLTAHGGAVAGLQAGDPRERVVELGRDRGAGAERVELGLARGAEHVVLAAVQGAHRALHVGDRGLRGEGLVLHRAELAAEAELHDQERGAEHADEPERGGPEDAEVLDDRRVGALGGGCL